MVDRLTAPKKRRTTSSRNFRLYAEEPVKGEPEPDDDNIGDFDPTKSMMNIEFVTLDNLHDILQAQIPEHPEIGRVRDVVDNINIRVKAIKSTVQNVSYNLINIFHRILLIHMHHNGSVLNNPEISGAIFILNLTY